MDISLAVIIGLAGLAAIVVLAIIARVFWKLLKLLVFAAIIAVIAGFAWTQIYPHRDPVPVKTSGPSPHPTSRPKR